MNSSRIEPIVVACAADRKYVMPLAAMIKSALTNLHHDRTIWLYVLDGGIDQNDKERLINSWDSDRLRADWVRVDQSCFSNVPLWGRMTVSTYHRLLMSEFLPKSLHKVIWLDCDMIVKGNLGDLWDMDLKDHAALAAQDMVVPYVSSRFGITPYQELGISRNAKYFNAGVMVVNLDWWRAHDVAGRAFLYLRQYGKGVYFWDQEALNAALADNWAELEPRWNQIASVSGRSFFPAAHLDSITYRQVVNDPLVMHFAGSLKPWTYYNQSTSRSLYFQYLDMTAWAGWRPPRTFQAILLGIYDSLLRDFLYPAEKWAISILRNRTRRKFRPITEPR